jgi:hypothetical protein
MQNLYLILVQGKISPAQAKAGLKPDQSLGQLIALALSKKTHKKAGYYNLAGRG